MYGLRVPMTWGLRIIMTLAPLRRGFSLPASQAPPELVTHSAAFPPDPQSSDGDARPRSRDDLSGPFAVWNERPRVKLSVCSGSPRCTCCSQNSRPASAGLFLAGPPEFLGHLFQLGPRLPLAPALLDQRRWSGVSNGLLGLRVSM